MKPDRPDPQIACNIDMGPSYPSFARIKMQKWGDGMQTCLSQIDMDYMVYLLYI